MASAALTEAAQAAENDRRASEARLNATVSNLKDEFALEVAKVEEEGAVALGAAVAEFNKQLDDMAEARRVEVESLESELLEQREHLQELAGAHEKFEQITRAYFPPICHIWALRRCTARAFLFHFRPLTLISLSPRPPPLLFL